MSNTTTHDKNQKITNFMTKVTSKTESNSKNPIKRPISPMSNLTEERNLKRQLTENRKMLKINIDKSQTNSSENPKNLTPCPSQEAENNSVLRNALGSLITKFRLLRESVDTIHEDYADLKQTISKQKEDLKQELADQIDRNISQLNEVTHKNKILHKENENLRTWLDHIEQNQLSNNVIITGIQEGPYEQYSTTKLRVQGIIVVTIDSGDTAADLEKAKGIEITSCNRVGKFRHNQSRPISVTFSTRDDKETLLSCKKKLPTGVYANEEFPVYIKQNHD